MNAVSLINQIVCLYQLYIYNIRDFIYKIKSIIVHMSELYFVNFFINYIKVLNLGILYDQVSNQY